MDTKIALIILTTLIAIFGWILKSWMEGKDKIIQLRQDNLELKHDNLVLLFKNFQQEKDTLIDEKQFNSQINHIFYRMDELKQQVDDVKKDVKELPEKMSKAINQWKP